MSKGIDKYWFVATNGDPCHSKVKLKDLKNGVSSLCDKVELFNIPLDLRYRSFDELISMLDDLQKQETSCEGMLKRIYRQVLELNPDAKMTINLGTKQVSQSEYIESFVWDDVRCPRSRNIVENLKSLTRHMHMTEEEFRSQLIVYNDMKQQLSHIDAKDGASFVTVDLGDFFYDPDMKQYVDDLFETRNLHTVVCVVPKNHEESFLTKYGNIEGVVPESARKVQKEDRDGNRIYIIVIMKKHDEEAKNHLRKLKVIPRDFLPDHEGYRKKLNDREHGKIQLRKQKDIVVRLGKEAYSDMYIGIVHMKALRVFVDSVLRYGKPIEFISYVVKPPSNSKKEAKLWKALHPKLTDNQIGDKTFDDDFKPFPFADLNL